MANPISTAIGRVQPLYKGEWSSTKSYDKLDNVIYEGSTYVSLQTNNIAHTPNVANSSYWQLIASKGNTGDIKTITVIASPSDSAWGTAVATGDPSEKELTFTFGLPKGDTGNPGAITSAVATAEQIGHDSSPWVEASISGEPSNATLSLSFGIPGAAGNVSTVDKIDPKNANVELTAVQFGQAQDSAFYINNFGVASSRVEEIMAQYQAQARSNIQAQIAGDYIVSPVAKTVNQFLKYAGNNNWVTESVNVFPAGGNTGEVLKKTDSGTEWSPVHEVIPGGKAGAVLTKVDTTNYRLTWSDPISNLEIDALFE